MTHFVFLYEDGCRSAIVCAATGIPANLGKAEAPSMNAANMADSVQPAIAPLLRRPAEAVEGWSVFKTIMSFSDVVGFAAKQRLD